MTAKPNPIQWVTKFTIIMIGQAFSLLGSGLVQFSIIWWLNWKTSSAVVLSTSMIMGVLPVIIFSPFAGVVADRYNRKKVMIIADTFVAMVTLLMSVLFIFGQLEIRLVYLLLFMRAMGSAFHQPAFESTMPLIAPPEHLVRTAAIIQMLRSGINLVAPMLAALLVAMEISLPDILLIDVVTAGIAVLTLAVIHIPDIQQKTEHHATIHGYFQDFISGLRYVYHWKGLLILILIFGLSNFLLSPILALMSLIIRQEFNGGVTEYGFFEMAYAIGIIIGGLLLSVWGLTRRKIVGINLAQIISGLALTGIFFVPADRFAFVLVAIAICGISSAYINSPATAIIQAKVDKDMQGRVMSIITMVCMVAMPLSLSITGPIANRIGLMPMVLIPGLLTAIIGVICFLIPPLMHIEDHQTAGQKETAIDNPDNQLSVAGSLPDSHDA